MIPTLLYCNLVKIQTSNYQTLIYSISKLWLNNKSTKVQKLVSSSMYTKACVLKYVLIQIFKPFSKIKQRSNTQNLNMNGYYTIAYNFKNVRKIKDLSLEQEVEGIE